MNSWIFGGQFASFERLAANARAIGEILVPPDVDDLVERSDLGVQERRELGVFLAVLVGVAETLLDLGEAAWSDLVGADLVNHVRLLSTGESWLPHSAGRAFIKPGA